MKHDYDLVIIGGGSAGLLAAQVAPRMGAKTALIERSRLGGDCLWTGCVPSKALIASAKAAHTIRHAGIYGLPEHDIEVDTARVWQRLRGIQNEIAQTDDSPERYRDFGVEVIFGEPSLRDAHTVDTGDRTLTTRFVLICTGSRPAVPPIDGLEQTGYLSSETLFDIERAPRSMLIVGGGPIGVETAQALRRLGVKTTVLEMASRILEREEPALSKQLCDVLEREGAELYTNVTIERAERTEGGKTLYGAVNGEAGEWTADEFFLAAGRRANVESLGLDRVGVETGPRGVVVDGKMRSSVPSIYAAGDCAGRYLFTHSAGSEAATALRNMFYPGSSEATTVVPWATFTDPELAHVGMTSTEAREERGDGIRVYEWPFSHNDRARTEGATDGGAVIVADTDSRILGAHLLAPGAGEMIGQFTMAIEQGLRLTPGFRDLIQVYPTFSTAFAQLASEAVYEQLERPLYRTLRRVNDFLPA